MTEKILSIAIPSYNVAGTIEKCLDSFIDERLKDYLEVIVVNDGSTDTTEEVVCRHIRKMPEVFRLVNQENGGHGAAVITGITHATGKYFRIIDGDDWVHTEELLKLVQYLKTCVSDMVVDVKTEYNMSMHTKRRFALPSYVPVNKICMFDDICTVGDIGSYIMIHTLTVRTGLLKQDRFALPQHVFYEDYEYITKASLRGETVVFLNEDVYCYRVGCNEQSVSAVNYVKRYSDHNRVLWRLLRFSGESHFEGNRRVYLDTKIKLFIHTQMNIELIFDTDRMQGLRRSIRLRKKLRSRYPYYERITRKRFCTALILHFLGIDYVRLQRLMGRS